MNKRLKWIAAPLILLMVVLSGCTAIGGLDINKALEANLTPKASESRQSLSVEIVPAVGKLTAGDLKAIELINSLSLTIDNAKVKDDTTLSLKGSIGYQGKKLPIQFSMDDNGIAFQVEGAKKPIYVSLDSSEYGLYDMTEYNGKAQEISRQTLGLILKHIPNPSTISVKQSQEKINGETLNLTNLHAEISGDELLTLIKPFLTNLSKDEQGLKDIISVIYDFTNTLDSLYGYEPEVETGSSLLNSKAVAVAAIYGVVQETFAELLKSYDEQVAALFEEAPELSTIFGKDTQLKVDLYFDGAQNIRKQVLDLKIAVPQSEDFPIQAIKVHSESETWNIGGNVAIDAVDTSSGVLDLSDGVVTPGQFLRNFESNSDIYKVLKNDLKVTQKYLLIDTLDDYYGVITVQNTALVPLRYLSEDLDAEVKWTKGSNKIAIIDDITGLEIVINVGSTEATVGGKAVTMPQPVFVDKDGTTYVPLRFIAQHLGALVHSDWDGWITIERP